MSIQHVNAVANRLSLRPPQRDSLQILDRLCEIVDFQKSTDPAEALKVIQSEFSHVEDFEREFPSLCFALATGVGKTRLMFFWETNQTEIFCEDWFVIEE